MAVQMLEKHLQGEAFIALCVDARQVIALPEPLQNGLGFLPVQLGHQRDEQTVVRSGVFLAHSFGESGFGDREAVSYTEEKIVFAFFAPFFIKPFLTDAVLIVIESIPVFGIVNQNLNLKGCRCLGGVQIQEEWFEKQLVIRIQPYGVQHDSAHGGQGLQHIALSAGVGAVHDGDWQ